MRNEMARHRVFRPGAPFGKELLLLALMAAFVTAGQAADFSRQALERADSFLKTEERGRDVLSYIHFGADYRGHQYLKTLTVNGSDSDFALVYRFNWADDGVTDAAFLCNSYGSVYAVQVMYTNAVLNRPFFLANASIAVLGHGLIQAFGGRSSPITQDCQRRRCQEPPRMVASDQATVVRRRISRNSWRR